MRDKNEGSDLAELQRAAELAGPGTSPAEIKQLLDDAAALSLADGATALTAAALAQTPPPTTKQNPPPGVTIPDADRKELETATANLGREIEALRGSLKANPAQLALLPDVQIFHKAVDWALRYDEMLDLKQIAVARGLLTQGMARAQALALGRTPWLEGQPDTSKRPFGDTCT